MVRWPLLALNCRHSRVVHLALVLSSPFSFTPLPPSVVHPPRNPVVFWSWDIMTDTCAICRNQLYEPSIEAQASEYLCPREPFRLLHPDDDEPPMWFPAALCPRAHGCL